MKGETEKQGPQDIGKFEVSYHWEPTSLLSPQRSDQSKGHNENSEAVMHLWVLLGCSGCGHALCLQP